MDVVSLHRYIAKSCTGQDPRHVCDAVLLFSAVANEPDELNAHGSKGTVHLITKVLVCFVVDHCNAPGQVEGRWTAPPTSISIYCCKV
jgi:hypothetical protein